MSINVKLIAGSATLVLVAATAGLLSLGSQLQLRDLAMRIHDEGLLPLRHLQAAENASSVLRGQYLALTTQDDHALRAGLGDTEAADLLYTLRPILDSLRLAADAPMSERAQKGTRELTELLGRLVAANGKVSRRMVLRDLRAAEKAFAETSRIVEDDAERLRAEVDAQASEAAVTHRAETAALLAAGLLVAGLLSLTVAMPVRRAVRTAKALAAGNLSDPIAVRGRGEVGALLAALAQTQASIAAHEREKEYLITAQANGYDAKIALHTSRFEAALNNMSQGLCMFDKNKKLVVYNEPFARLFGHHTFETHAAVVLPDPRFGEALSSLDTDSFNYEMPDGQFLAIKRTAVPERGIVMTFENITEQHRTSQKLAHVAGHDPLTDLANRRRFCERLDALLAARGRRGSAAVISLDLRSFKSVNNTYGHAVGDQLLAAVGQALVNCAGAANLVARFAADEFAILQADTETENTTAFAHRVLGCFSEPFDVAGRRIAVGAAVGIHVVHPNAPAADRDCEAVLKNCDLALFEAKAQGRNAFRFFVPGMRDQAVARRILELDLVSALERREFELFYQPFVDVERGGVSGFEALLRWRHPVRGMVSPAHFIPIAESLGLINEIGLWALREACAFAASWPEDLSISVNLSPVQIKSPGLIGSIDRVLAETGLAPTRLHLEVTESVFLDKTEELLAALKALRQRGILIAMDDFGTGYSSLGYLSRFPFSKLKIDQSFVRDLGKPENIAIVRAVISLSKAMGMTVIAEGIETREQHDIIYREGCREMQGYYFSKPRPAGDLPRVMAEIASMVRRSPDRPRADRGPSRSAVV